MDTHIDSNKLPPVNMSFWIMVITATTLGETAGDLLSMTMKVGYAMSSIILVSLFIISLAFQLISKSKHRALFWTVIILTSTAGTTLSDYINRTLDLGYTKGSLLLLALLVATFVTWSMTAKSLALKQIKTVQSEALYWAAILFSSTLGTSLGDYLADDTGLNLGFGGGAAWLAVMLIIIVVLNNYTRISKVVLFWLAIVVTHPIGACMGDYLTKPKSLGFSPLPSTVGLMLLFILVATVISRKTTSK